MSVLTNGALPATASLVLHPLTARIVAAGFGAGYLGGGATGYQKVDLEKLLALEPAPVEQSAPTP